MIVVAIHQPNFVPFYPFFQKMEQADIFVIMKECQFEKNNYQNRFFTDKWNTMSVNAGLEPIKVKKYLNYEKDWTKIVQKYPKLEVFTSEITESLWKSNTKIITKTAELLGINTAIVLDYPTILTGSERLLDICKTYNATTYLSGISGKKYLNTKIFNEAGIKVIFQDENKMIKQPLINFL